MFIRLSHSPDGFGFLYGTYAIDEETTLRIDLMPPTELWKGDIRLTDLPVPGEWVAHVDGEEIGRAGTRDVAMTLIETAIGKYKAISPQSPTGRAD